MEPASLAVGIAGIAGLFTNAVQLFEYVQIGRTFGTDFETSQLKLDNTRLRLSRWGEAVQIHSDKTFVRSEVDHAQRNINKIMELFANAEGVAKEFRNKAGADTDIAAYDPGVDMNAQALALHGRMRDLAVARQEKGKRGAVGLVQKTKWTLYEKPRFKELINDITELVDGLEKIFPVEQETKRLCEEEATAISSGATLPLLEVAVEQDSGLVEAVRKVLGEREARQARVVFSGSNNRGFQIGNNSRVEASFIHVWPMSFGA